MRQTLPYGILPEREAFDKAFQVISEDSLFVKFANDEVFGNCQKVGVETLWLAMQKQIEIGTDQALDWCSWVLSVLGFKWI